MPLIVGAIAGILLLAAIVGGAVYWFNRPASSGASVTVTQTQDQQTETNPQTQTQTVTTTTSTMTMQPTSTAWPAQVTQVCSANVATGPNTSCPFAENVSKAVDGAYSDGTLTPGQTFQVRAYSPARDWTYTMTCIAGPVVLCTGGDNASVYSR